MRRKLLIAAAVVLGVALSGAAGAFTASQLRDPAESVRYIPGGVGYPEGPARFEEGLTIAGQGGGLSDPLCTGDGLAITAREAETVVQVLVITAGGGLVTREGDTCTRSGDASTDSWNEWRVNRPLRTP